jgi:hypothetical protein
MFLFLIGLPISLVFGLVGNLLTPYVQELAARTSARWRAKQVEKVHDDLALMTVLRASPSAAVGQAGRRLLPTLTSFAYTVLFNVVGLVLGTHTGQVAADVSYGCAAAGILLLVAAAFSGFRAATFFHGLADPDWYARRASEQLRRLGAPQSRPTLAAE